MATVLVTGGTGFIGRELVRQSLARGDAVTVLSRRRPEAKVEWLEADITEAAELARALEGRHFPVVYHLASLPGDTGNPTEMVGVNVTGLTHMLEFARASGVQRFVLTSSISAYGWFPATPFEPPLHMPVDEDHPCRPKDMYSVTKWMQELLVFAYYHQYQVPTVALRVTAVVGPEGAGGGRMWADFAVQVKEGKRVQLPMLSPEEQCHFVDRRDVAAMHIAAAQHPAAVGEAFNCCGPGPTRGHEFAAIVKELLPEAEVAFGYPWSMAQGGQIAFDMSKAKRLMGFAPQYPLREAVRSIHDWIRAGG